MSGGTAPPFLTSALDRMSGQFHTPAAGKSPRYPLDRKLGGAQGRFGRCEVEKHLLPLLGIEP
jgi:hypothetical protein